MQTYKIYTADISCCDKIEVEVGNGLIFNFNFKL